jgi:RsiW-degrading membrane proteinase PrsW (M82 family)
VILHAILALCALGAGLLVRRHDMHDREPWWALLGVALLGGLLAPLCGAAEDAVVRGITSTPSSALIAAAAAGIEEGARLLAVLAVAVLLPRVFNDPMDGIAYGSVAGIGMSVYESWLYLGPSPALEGPLAALEFARLGEHMVLGGIAGFPLGMARTGFPHAGRAFATCVPAAVGLHFAVDAAALATAGDAAAAGRASLFVASCVLAGFLLYGALATIASEWSRRMFAPLSARTLLGWPFTLLGRRRGGPRA